LLEDIRCWLLDRIDGSEETKGDDGLISDFVRKLDALSSEMGATVEPRGCPTPGACSAVEELADLKQRLLPQYLGRAERAESHLAAAETQLQEAWRQVAQTMDAPRSATAAPKDDLVQQLNGALMNSMGQDFEISAAFVRDELIPALKAARVEETAIGHARYEYLRTLNPRKFAALYNEALMGVHQFDDLVDRYRMKGEKP